MRICSANTFLQGDGKSGTLRQESQTRHYVAESNASIGFSERNHGSPRNGIEKIRNAQAVKNCEMLQTGRYREGLITWLLVPLPI